MVGTDASTDLAVIKVDAPDSVLHPLTVGDSSDVQVGNTVFALGSPLGLEDSFTSGIVSALHRQIEARNGFSINDSIRPDAGFDQPRKLRAVPLPQLERRGDRSQRADRG